MKKTYLIYLFSSLALLSSCGPQKAETDEQQQAEQTENEVRSLPDYAYTDSLMQGSHKVVYAITSGADSTLQIVQDEDGTKYADNRFKLVVTKDGKTLFGRSFTKGDFKSQLPEDFQKYGIMDGMRFHHAEEGKLYFSTCVSFPDSDMSCPFILTIGPDGSYTITPDTSLPEEDELPPTLQEENE
ncbi:MAG: DUF4738 domain-containing protein [Bacteroidaceae bacterium]|nr:DUF4738 domain-containing protein [Bacteroidaceae bacterium]